MKCMHCGAPTEVDETRVLANGYTVRRRRRCFNGHVMRTYEVMETVWGKAKERNADAVQAAERRAHILRRNARILRALAAGQLAKQIALDEGLTESSISLIKRKANGDRPSTVR